MFFLLMMAISFYLALRATLWLAAGELPVTKDRVLRGRALWLACLGLLATAVVCQALAWLEEPILRWLTT